MQLSKIIKQKNNHMIELRELKVGDTEKLIPLFQVLTNKEIIIDSAALIADEKISCLVFDDDSEIAGFGCLVIHSVPTKGEVARIEDIIIGENYQRKGLGRKMIEALLEIAKDKNISRVNLTSNPMRVGAHKLYESVGFSRINTDTFSITI
jgi:phosphinothricin acetyltransferase